MLIKVSSKVDATKDQELLCVWTTADKELNCILTEEAIVLLLAKGQR
jgi:hypothetical protein